MALSTPSASIYSEEERAEIQRQLERLLGNAHFSHSRRFPSFLRFIVLEELEGRGELLKERTLGVEVFGRDAGYDTTSDPIVRVTAAEIRKRIAQYYQDSGNPDELKISLPSGSYVPHFEWPRPTGTASAPEPVYAGAVDLQQAEAREVALAARRKSKLPWIAGLVVVALVAVGGWVAMHPGATTLDSFWAPMLGSGEPVVVCFPQGHYNGITLRNAQNPEEKRQFDEPWSGVVVDDLQPLVTVSGLLEMRHQHYRLMGEDTATLTDLRQGPAIFIGAFDTAWTLRVTNGLRFRFANDADMSHFWIEDTQSKDHQRWAIDRHVQKTTNNYRDYAIVARVRDANTGQLAVVAAGIARGGTVAAGEFLTQPGDMDAIKAQAPPKWAGENMEFVLSTEIIDGKSSPPKVEAVYFW